MLFRPPGGGAGPLRRGRRGGPGPGAGATPRAVRRLPSPGPEPPSWCFCGGRPEAGRGLIPGATGETRHRTRNTAPLPVHVFSVSASPIRVPQSPTPRGLSCPRPWVGGRFPATHGLWGRGRSGVSATFSVRVLGGCRKTSGACTDGGGTARGVRERRPRRPGRRARRRHLAPGRLQQSRTRPQPFRVPRPRRLWRGRGTAPGADRRGRPDRGDVLGLGFGREYGDECKYECKYGYGYPWGGRRAPGRLRRPVRFRRRRLDLAARPRRALRGRGRPHLPSPARMPPQPPALPVRRRRGTGGLRGHPHPAAARPAAARCRRRPGAGPARGGLR